MASIASSTTTPASTAARDSSRSSRPGPTSRRVGSVLRLRRRRPAAARLSSWSRTRPRPSTSSPGGCRSFRTMSLLTTHMEHHSDDLPFRGVARVRPRRRAAPTEGWTKTTSTGSSRPIAGRSVWWPSPAPATSPATSIRSIGWRGKAHAAGAWIAVDAAQLGAPSSRSGCRSWTIRSISTSSRCRPTSCMHRYGGGALVGRRDVFEQGEPEKRGGGTVEMVTVDDVVWAARQTATTPYGRGHPELNRDSAATRHERFWRWNDGSQNRLREAGEPLLPSPLAGRGLGRGLLPSGCVASGMANRPSPSPSRTREGDEGRPSR